MKAHRVWFTALLCYAVIATVTAEPSTAPERVLWDKRPIPVHIQQGQERIIHFPAEIRYWLPDSLKHRVRALAANGVLYLRARHVFPTTRIRVQSLADQQVFLLDVMADNAASVSDELIVMTEATVANRAKDRDPETSAEDWRVRLTRYAAQQLYAPARLLSGDSHIKRIPIPTGNPVPLIRGGHIEALPIAAWQGGGLTVTAVKLRNLLTRSVHLSFEPSEDRDALNLTHHLRGHWLTAAVQHNDLEPAGQPADTTTLYLVSERTFVESLGLPVQQSQPSNQTPGNDADG